MRYGLINLVVSILTLFTFWIYHRTTYSRTGEDWFKNQKHVFTYDVRGVNNSVQLFSHELMQWIADKDVGVDSYPVRESVRILITSFCKLNTTDSSSLLHKKCCSQLNPRTDKSDLIWCLQELGHIGPLPIVREARNGSKNLPIHPPNYIHPAVYFDTPGPPNRELGCRVELAKRESTYQLLRQWILLAEKHGIVWWLNYGSLLGALRHKDFIPYDHDADITMLGSYEDVLRRLSIDWKKVNYSQPFLITRQGSYCINDHGPRLNCRGVPVRFQLDPCAFCTPIGRLISSYFTYFDIFLVHAKAIIDLTNPNNTRIGLLDEAVDGDTNKTFSYPLDHVFPLTTCTYMGLKLPCPRKPELILSHTYGNDYLKPSKVCSERFGIWYSA